MPICEQCNKEHDGSYGSGRFCCRSCSNKWVALHQSEEAKAKKIEKGKNNLNRKGWKLTPEQQLAASKKGGEATAKLSKERRRLRLERILSGEDKTTEVYQAGYARFREELIEFGYKERRCELCGLEEWQGKPIPLQLHHKNCETVNHELSNLQLLCPNCHALTDSYGWKYYNNYKRLSEIVNGRRFESYMVH